MVGVDAAIAAEVMLCGMRIELVKLQMLRAFKDADAAQWDRSNNRALAPADGAVTTARVDDAVWKIQLQLHRATVTRGKVLGLYLDSVNLLKHCECLR